MMQACKIFSYKVVTKTACVNFFVAPKGRYLALNSPSSQRWKAIGSLRSAVFVALTAT